MAATRVDLPAQITTDAEFRTWAQSISNALLASGWVKTADTGQINLATVVKPGAAQTAAGYEIWRMDDALQATFPVFLKVEYGTYTQATYQSVWFTTGTGSNGAGALTGVQSSRRQIASFAASATLLPSFYSGATDRFGIVMNVTVTNSFPGYYFIERTKDADGNNTADGIIITAMPNSSTFTETVVSPAGQQTPEAGLLAFSLTATGIVGLDINVMPVFYYMPSKGLAGPKLAHLIYWNADIPAGTPFTLTIGGVPRTYMAVGQVGNTTVLARGANSASMALAMRYE